MRTVAVLLLTAVAIQTGAAQARKKQVKDLAELEIYTQARKDAGEPAKEIRSLDTWTRKYPESQYKDDRLYMYMQAYSRLDPSEPAKVIDYGSRLIAKGLHTVFAC